MGNEADEVADDLGVANDVEAVDGDSACSWFSEAGEDAQEVCFACAVGAHEGEALTFGEGEVDAA